MNVSDLGRKSACPGGSTEGHCGHRKRGSLPQRDEFREESPQGNRNWTLESGLTGTGRKVSTGGDSKPKGTGRQSRAPQEDSEWPLLAELTRSQ